MYLLDPIFEYGLLRTASLELKHPVILPREGIVTQLILDDCHKRTQQQGCGQTLNELSVSGYWIIGASKMVANRIKSCVTWRKACLQIEENKRYDLLFTCLSSRAVHIEMLEDLTTDVFLSALRCFIAIRGAVRQSRCDWGSNFVGATNVLQNSLMELDKEVVETGQSCGDKWWWGWSSEEG